MEEGIYLEGTFDASGDIKWIGTAKSSYGNWYIHLDKSTVRFDASKQKEHSPF